MYTFDKITHIHILFTLWPSETTSKTHETHARTHTRTYTYTHTRFRLYVTTSTL